MTSKKILLSLIVLSMSFGCKQTNKETDSKETVLPRIAIAGLAIESSTFSPAFTNEEAFQNCR